MKVKVKCVGTGNNNKYLPLFYLLLPFPKRFTFSFNIFVCELKSETFATVRFLHQFFLLNKDHLSEKNNNFGFLVLLHFEIILNPLTSNKMNFSFYG